MIKRYNPDASHSISHEHAWMRETPEGGHVQYGDYASLFSQFEALKASHDALLAENAALKASRETLAKNALETCNDVFSAGFRNASLQLGLMESTGNRNLYPNPIKALVDEAIRELTTPNTDAALAAIEARGVEKLADKLDAEIEQIMRGAFFYDEISSREAISKMVRAFAAELREAK